MPLYRYPDTEDHLIAKFLEVLEHNEIYWAESESAILDFILSHLADNPNTKWETFLDAGCGEGRLLSIFAKHFRRGIAIEPDILRFEKATQIDFASEGFADISFFNVTAEAYRHTEVFDFILSSHVIQHIHTEKVFPLMENLRNHLSAQGMIALTTCQSFGTGDTYGKNYLEKGVPVQKIIDEEEFNLLVDRIAVLPMHFFCHDLLIRRLADIGLKTVGFKVFHVSREDRIMLKRDHVDDWVNANPERQKNYGVDMCLLLRKA